MGSDDGSNMYSNPCAEGDFIVRALHEYHSDSVGHLSFSQFQYIKVKQCEQSGWWFGESENNRGWFPSNRVERVDPVYETEYLSRPTSITSEDYDQIRTGLDGVETQFLGEPMVESVPDSMQMDWGVMSSPSIGWTRPGQLAFPSSQLAVPFSYYGLDASAMEMDGDFFYQQAISSAAAINSDATYAYSDFVGEVALYVRELKEAAQRGDIDRYQPIVANIISCVKALLIFTNTIARESEILQTYPELAGSRRDILRALGKLYSKCRVANGSQARTTSRQRQFAVEKLSIFGGQVLDGITDFATHARRIGLRIRSGATFSARGSEFDMFLKSPKDFDNMSSSSSTYTRSRRRVSRVNSAKGYKSFNAVRQLKMEHQQKYNTAKRAIEHSLMNYMECLNSGGNEMPLDHIMVTTIQSAQAVEMFLISAEEMKARTNTKEDGDYAEHKMHLSSALNELLIYIQTVESAPVGSHKSETVLTRFMNITSELFKCLLDMEGYPRTNSTTSQDLSSLVKRVSTPKNSSAELKVGSIPESTGDEAMQDSQLDFSYSANTVPSPSLSPRQRGSASPKATLNRKFGSATSLNERYKRQSEGKGSPRPSFYDEDDDVEVGANRSNHDSAVVMTNLKSASHDGLTNASKIPPVHSLESGEERDDVRYKAFSATSRLPSQPYPQEGNKRTEQEIETAMKSAARVATEIFIPAQEVSTMREESLIPSSHTTYETFDSDARTSSASTLRARNFDDKVSRGLKASNPAISRTSEDRRRERSSQGSNARRSIETERALAQSRDVIGLGVSVPTDLHSKASSSSLTSDHESRISRTRSPVPSVSPRLEPSRRPMRPDYSPNPSSSPSIRSESRASARGDNAFNIASNSATISRSRRGSLASIRSEESEGRPLDDGRLNKESDLKTGADTNRSSSSTVSATLQSEVATTQMKDEELLSRLSTPTTPHIQTFGTDGSIPYRPGKSHHRESVMSNASVVTESNMQSPRAGAMKLRPSSPAMRGRVSHESFMRGRASIESTMSMDRHNQLSSSTRIGTQPLTYRQQRQNKVGQAKIRVSEEYKQNGTVSTSAPSSAPWYLDNDYEADEVLYNDNGTLVAATFEAYIEMLTSHKTAPEPAFVNTFFLTFRLFTTPVDLVQALVKRFVKAPPRELTPHEVLAWQHQKQERVQKRVHIAIKTWLEGYWVSEKDRDAFNPIMEFVKHEMMEAVPGPAGRLLDVLNQWVTRRKSLHLSGSNKMLSKSRSHERIDQVAQDIDASDINNPPNGSGEGYSGSGNNSTSDTSSPTVATSTSKPFATLKEKSSMEQFKRASRRGLAGTFNRESLHIRGPPVPLVSKALLNALANDQLMSKIPVTDIKPVELARQLTIMANRLFTAIPYLELFEKERPNCSRMVQASTKITNWITDTIVDEQDVKKRVGVVKHWIEVGEECLKLNNFDTLTAISFAIESTPVRRLQNTWEGISKSYIERSIQLKKMISNEYNYSVYRAKLKTVQAPCIPFLGLYFTVIAYIEDGNSMYKEVNPNINPIESAPNSSSTSTSETAASIPTYDASSTMETQNAIPPTAPMPTNPRKLLRYGRFAQLARTVQEFRDFQGMYELLEVPRLHSYIMKCMENLDSERSWRKSLAIEPRRPAPGVAAGGPNGVGSYGIAIGGLSSGGPINRPGGVGGKGLFNGGLDVNNGSSSMPAKLNKFFRKSTRHERS
ncbi:hypothetical protein BX616_009135 [Lobosporangium transversale]|uniref:Ras guanine nucleotide exchange factor domain-containing protein n=1 Tax=Lobosporangium transversale TaxID=64571 RepID=A0A1Y2GBB8_9FUNG|nr:hypothetical protein BCR41DRAFT_172074 [Lobosporangium transversale]KAF9914016.1 hypothetical protein BX616_009135 [Lobosporangium transversale]ORZ06159.1 hypothetical protein BCR41DRAFT_172074 [Lobosporangium transversale]|eukprot:XP_021877428.1 hypothetical protein BCR41DRAFT_172074 [Lobosporangium transversale]